MVDPSEWASRPSAVAPLLMHDRSIGRISSRSFRSGIMSQRSALSLSEDSHVASAHQLSIESLQVDRNENRFLLAGSRDATVSIYDLSKWGTEYHLQGKAIGSGNRTSCSVYPAIAHSLPRSSDPVVDAQWYASDTGAFVTASAQGSLSVWDTDAMKSVADYQSLLSCYCMHLSPLSGRSQNIAAVGAKFGSTTGVKLVDLQSGAASHSLVGHQGGVTAVQWSPVSDVVLASGSIDGTIRLWDIRKSGSRSCLCVLDRDTALAPSRRPFRAHYAHLAPRRNHFAAVASPNDFRRSESNAVVSHGGAVTGLSFATNGWTLVSTGTDGKLQVWDLRGSGHLVPIAFLCRGSILNVSRLNQRVPLVVKQYGAEPVVWVGMGSRILGYSLHRGGAPSQVLEGHMLSISAIDSIDSSMQLVSGANDGMILSWDSTRPVTRESPDDRKLRRKRPREVPQVDQDSW